MKKFDLIGDMFPEFKGESPQVAKVLEEADKVALSKNVILLEGALGTGKRSFSKLIHKWSNAQGEFVEIDLIGLESSEIEATLFGNSSKEGMLKKAKGGTLFCSGIESLSQSALAYLLDLLKKTDQNLNEYLKDGILNMRIVLSTLGELSLSEFKSEFYFSVKNSQTVKLPTLNERREDIRTLVSFFVKEASEEHVSVRKGVFLLLSNFPFKSNIIELKQMILNGLKNCSGGSLKVDDFDDFDDVEYDEDVVASCLLALRSIPNLPSMELIKEQAMEEALFRTNGNQTLAAKMLGITRKTIFTYLKEKNED